MVPLNLNKKYTSITHCRVCGSGRLLPILDLGNQPLANSLKKKPAEKEDRYPLTLVFCRNCSLVQLRETVKKEILFDNYIWLTQTSATAKKYAGLFYKRAVTVTKAKPGDFIIEVASNDGTFLKPFIRGGYKVLGVDPAQNLARLANKQGVRTMPEYWGLEIAQKIISQNEKAKIIIARNVIPHVSELQDVIAGMYMSLSEKGIGIIEFHYAGQIMQELHYDSIYHEHLCYFSIKSISSLLTRYNLVPFHIETSPISGGSYVIYFSQKKRRKSANYLKLLEKENRIGANKIQAWKRFAALCYKHREKSIEIAESFSSKTVLGFGASARSSTYLNFSGFDSGVIKAIIDNNPLKQGMISPGTSIPIVSLKKGMQMNPDLIFILAWNFRDEIAKECRSKGYSGEYLVAFPGRPYYFNFKG